MATVQSRKDRRVERTAAASRNPAAPRSESGPPGRTSLGSCKLPGLAGALRLYEARDAYLRPFAVLSSQQASNLHTVVLETAAESADGVPPELIEGWLGSWDNWMATISGHPPLVAAAVTLETIDLEPDRGFEPGRPSLWSLISGEDEDPAVEEERLRPPRVRICARIALTFDASARDGHGKYSPQEMSGELGRLLPRLSAGLQLTGNGPAKPMTGAELAELVRMAYDPSIAGLIGRLGVHGTSGIRWDQAGPTASDESWERFGHDGAQSMSWTASQNAAKGEMPVLISGLLDPVPEVVAQRATVLYKPSAGDGDTMARGGRGGRRQPPEPTGAGNPWTTADTGLVRHGMVGTVTVANRQDMAWAELMVDEIPSIARLSLRRAFGSQASAFVAGLPLGIVAPDRFTLPQNLRDGAEPVRRGRAAKRSAAG